MGAAYWLIAVIYQYYLQFYKYPGRAWIDADITELLSFRRKSILSGDMNAKHPFWNSSVSNPSGEKLLNLFDVHEFEMSASRCRIHYFPARNGDVLDIVIHQNIRLSGVIVSGILDSDHVSALFCTLDHVQTNNLWTTWKIHESDTVSFNIT
jgi:hypothetical protein